MNSSYTNTVCEHTLPKQANRDCFEFYHELLLWIIMDSQLSHGVYYFRAPLYTNPDPDQVSNYLV